MVDFIIMRRLDLSILKWKYDYIKDKCFYKNSGDDYIIYVILGDSIYCRIKIEDVFKGKVGEFIVEGMIFGWVIYGDYVIDGCLFIRETSDYE